MKNCRFSRRRGRPKIDRPKIDTGTPETANKIKRGITKEPIDLLFEKQLINQYQHWCAIHLRWLYTLRYGVVNVKAIDVSRSYDMSISQSNDNNELWNSERESEYNNALNRLKLSGYDRLILNLCVYNEYKSVSGIYPMLFGHNCAHKYQKIEENIVMIRDGLDILVNLWAKNKIYS
ncbi:MAG: hypothetical protein R3D71_06785 [Rickettsiales bacterium]